MPMTISAKNISWQNLSHVLLMNITRAEYKHAELACVTLFLAKKPQKLIQKINVHTT